MAAPTELIEKARAEFGQRATLCDGHPKCVCIVTDGRHDPIGWGRTWVEAFRVARVARKIARARFGDLKRRFAERRA